MEMQASGNAEEFIESVKVDLFPDKVYVFTPKGAILRLPRGATVVDFAYAVHTDIGNRCVAAKIDRRLAPLRSVLRNGQTVQIITAKGASPNPSWVNFVATAKARSAIRTPEVAARTGPGTGVAAQRRAGGVPARGEAGPEFSAGAGERIRAERKNCWPDRSGRLAPLVRGLLPGGLASRARDAGLAPAPGL
jgi:hypothetical protein